MTVQRRRYVNSRGEKSRRKIGSGSDRRTHEFSESRSVPPRGNVIFARELLIGGIAARTPDGAAASNRRRDLARIGETRPAIGRGVSVCSDDPFRQTATCRCSPLSESPGDSRLCAQPIPPRGRKRERGRCVLASDHGIVVNHRYRSTTKSIHTRSQRSEPDIIGAQ